MYSIFFHFEKVQLQPNVCYALHDGDEVKFGDVISLFKEQKETDVNFHIKIIG